MLGQTLGEDAGVIHFDVKVDTIKKKVLPELSDEWAHNNFGFENLADMRTQIAQSIKDQKEMNKGIYVFQLQNGTFVRMN